MDLLTLENFFTLLMLILLQAVLGFDNLLYISIESKRAPADQQAWVRKLGIGLAVALRLILLFVVMRAIQSFKTPWFDVHWEGYLECEVTLHGLIVFAGGAFIIYTALREITHMLAVDDIGGHDQEPASVAKVVTAIVLMNLIFSFDSILSALALTDIFAVMATAIVISGILMIWLADRVSDFLKRNRMYEVLGLFVLLIVGVMLVSEGGHLVHLKLFTYAVEPMTKTTFYFVITVMVLVDLVQGRYQKKLLAERQQQRRPA